MPPSFPFQDSGQPIAARVRDLISHLTLPEKVSLMKHDSAAIERLGIPAYNWWNECLHGVARAGIATVFPQALGMAAAFNTGLAGRIAAVISDEARAKHHAHASHGERGIYTGLTFFTPNINIFRDPRWGRGQETYGECPCLTSRIGVAFVRGLQGADPVHLKVAATAKHYAVHSGPESLRHSFNAVVSKKDLFETYLPAFRDLVVEAGVELVLTAYNRINGEVCCASPLLVGELLRGKWAFQGTVVSDCWAIRDINEGHGLTRNETESAAYAVRGGCNLNCGCAFGFLTDAVEQGLISESEIDQAVERLLTTRFRLGQFDPPEKVRYASIPYEILDCPDHRELSLKAALESVILLKNENQLLPLRKDLSCIAVIGPNTDNRTVLLGNYNGTPSHAVTPLEGIRNAVSPATRVLYAQGCDLVGDGENILPDMPDPLRARTEAVLAAERADVVIACMGLSAEIEGEQGSAALADLEGDRAGLSLAQVQVSLLETLAATGKPVVLLIMTGSAVDLSWAQENLPAILLQFYPGQEGGTALAQVLFGESNPAGRLPVTFYRSVEDLPPFEDYTMEGRTYRYFRGNPVYPFGFGLSYTRFEYRSIRPAKTAYSTGEKVEVAVDLANIGEIAGDEVVQVYLTHVSPSVKTPIRQLAAFERIHLNPGETRTVTFSLDPRWLALVDEEGRRFIEAGEIQLDAGGCQPDSLSQRLGGSAPVSCRIQLVGDWVQLPV